MYLYGKTFEHPLQNCLMNTLYRTLRILGITITAITIISCAGGKNNDNSYSLTEETPFKIGPSYFQKWVAGVRGGGSGTNVHLVIEELEEGVVLKELYFQKQVTTLYASKNEIDQFMGSFKNDENRDVIMDVDPVKEAQNVPPEAFPFDLDENEAVIGYTFNGEAAFALVSDMKEKPLLAYPSQSPKDID